MKVVLLVDDAQEGRILTKWFLANFGFAVDCVSNAADALELFDPRLHDAVITDNSMPGMTGEELAHIIKLRSPSTPLIMYTGSAPKDRSCIDCVIQRPTHLMVLKEALDGLLAARDGAEGSGPA